MHIMKMAALFLNCCLTVAGATPQSGHTSQLPILFQKLQEPATTDKAARELLKLGQKDPAAKQYLASALPPLIAKGPTEPSAGWSNAVRLAGDLRIPEAAAALGKWIGLNAGGTVGISSDARLQNYPVGKALAEIGDPSIPTLIEILDHGVSEDRRISIIALTIIHSQKAKIALESYLNHEEDADLQSYVKRLLEDWDSHRR